MSQIYYYGNPRKKHNETYRRKLDVNSSANAPARSDKVPQSAPRTTSVQQSVPTNTREPPAASRRALPESTPTGKPVIQSASRITSSQPQLSKIRLGYQPAPKTRPGPQPVPRQTPVPQSERKTTPVGLSQSAQRTTTKPQSVPTAVQQAGGTNRRPQPAPIIQPGSQSVLGTKPGQELVPDTNPGRQSAPAAKPGQLPASGTSQGPQPASGSYSVLQPATGTNPGPQTVPAVKSGPQPAAGTKPLPEQGTVPELKRASSLNPKQRRDPQRRMSKTQESRHCLSLCTQQRSACIFFGCLDFRVRWLFWPPMVLILLHFVPFAIFVYMISVYAGGKELLAIIFACATGIFVLVFSLYKLMLVVSYYVRLGKDETDTEEY